MYININIYVIYYLILIKFNTNIKTKNCNNNFFYFIHSFSKSDDKILNNETLIISMTSYPPRINFVKISFDSIIKQKIDPTLYHCVLVLSITEFINKELDLPKDLLNLVYSEGIEIIWYNKNIKSHKKIIPTLKKYPNNPILIVDDDTLRNEGFIQTFLDDHKKFPNDIIFGYTDVIFTKEYKFVSKKKFKKNEYILARPANGLGGTLYPPHTFKDKRFFNEEIFMKLTPNSDESWQWCFLIMENKSFRKLSKNFAIKQIRHSQKISLYKENKNKYNIIIKKLYDYFPEFKKQLDIRIKKCYN